MNAKKQCDLCQAYGNHLTKNCPSLICDECDEKGHCKKYCPYLKHPEEDVKSFLESFEEEIKVKEPDKCFLKLRKQLKSLKGRLLKLQTLYSSHSFIYRTIGMKLMLILPA